MYNILLMLLHYGIWAICHVVAACAIIIATTHKKSLLYDFALHAVPQKENASVLINQFTEHVKEMHVERDKGFEEEFKVTESQSCVCTGVHTKSIQPLLPEALYTYQLHSLILFP